MSACDGCQRLFEGPLTTVNAKGWKPSICNVSVEASRDCSRSRCEFSVEGECCVEFNFCDACVKDRKRLDRSFKYFAQMNL